MYQPLLEGMKVGMVLCFMLGPIFFALVQTGVERGFRAGAAIGLGVWVSDFLYIVAVLKGLSFMSSLSNSPAFKFWLGICGGLLLVGFGVASLFSSPKPNKNNFTTSSSGGALPYFSLWLKGFVINTFNPFSVFFWVGWTTTLLIRDNLTSHQTQLFFVGVLGTIAATDLLKVLLAKQIRRWLQPIHVVWLRRLSGIALVAFGIMLAIQSI